MPERSMVEQLNDLALMSASQRLAAAECQAAAAARDDDEEGDK